MADSIRAEILAALSEAGACCGDCGFEPGETGCPDCVRVRELYADALMPVLDRRPSCPDPIECGHEAALGQAQEQHRRALLAAEAGANILQQQIDAQAHELDEITRVLQALRRHRDMAENERDTLAAAIGRVRSTCNQVIADRSDNSDLIRLGQQTVADTVLDLIGRTVTRTTTDTE